MCSATGGGRGVGRAVPSAQPCHGQAPRVPTRASKPPRALRHQGTSARTLCHCSPLGDGGVAILGHVRGGCLLPPGADNGGPTGRPSPRPPQHCIWQNSSHTHTCLLPLSSLPPTPHEGPLPQHPHLLRPLGHLHRNQQWGQVGSIPVVIFGKESPSPTKLHRRPPSRPCCKRGAAERGAAWPFLGGLPTENAQMWVCSETTSLRV